MGRPYRDPDWLDARYHDDGLTQREIGELCGVSATTVRKQMKAFGIETRDPVGEHHGLYGKERSEETKRKISDSMRGRVVSEETRQKNSAWQRGRGLPEDVREKIATSLTGLTRSDETRVKMSRSTAGEKNPNWKGGAYSDEWYGPGWPTIRNRVRERDQVCQHCGRDNSSVQLDVHHVVPIRLFRETEGVSVEEANIESNLVLLCKRCHGLAEHGLIEIDGPDAERLPEAIRGLFDP